MYTHRTKHEKYTHKQPNAQQSYIHNAQMMITTTYNLSQLVKEMSFQSTFKVDTESLRLRAQMVGHCM